MPDTPRSANNQGAPLPEQNGDDPAVDPVDAAFAAYLRSCDTGQLHSRDAFIAQFPDLADELKELITAADMFGRVTVNQGFTPAPDTSASGHDVRVDEASIDDAGAVDVRVEPGADTLIGNAAGADHKSCDPAATLPVANRPKGDTGPTLPFDLGDYMLLRVIGRGGMGVVYLAKQSELERHVAVKMIRSGILADDSEVRRFYTEAQAAARLHHSGIVAVHQFGRRAGHHFFSMEYVEGIDLQRRIDSGMMEPRQAARYVRDVARAIHHAHQKGVLHRDLKPANVLIDEHDQVHVTDFGLAKHMDADSSVTGSGAAVGTPHYMAPEQADGRSDAASRQSDVYSLGALLFACLTGRPPIVADTVTETLVKVVHELPPPVRAFRSDVSLDLETIVAKCLEKKPNQRYHTTEQLATELDAFLEGRPIEARPRSRAMKAWHWLEGVPLVGALSGRRVLHSSATHRRFQAGLLLLLILTPIATAGLLTYWQSQRNAMPRIIQFAGGIDGGVYNQVSMALARRMESAHGIDTMVATSSGSLHNHDQIVAGTVDIAPVQATAISGDHVRVVAPLFFELLYVFVRADSSIQSIEDFRGRSVAVGPAGSGSRATAELVLQSFDLSPQEVAREITDWEALFSDAAPEAAIMCMGRGSPLVARLLSQSMWRLLPIPKSIAISLKHPTLKPMSIDPEEFENSQFATNPITASIPTLGTTAFLAADVEAPSELVLGLLNALYQEPPPFEGLIPRHQAAEWHGQALHPAARHYFEQFNTE